MPPRSRKFKISQSNNIYKKSRKHCRVYDWLVDFEFFERDDNYLSGGNWIFHLRSLQKKLEIRIVLTFFFQNFLKFNKESTRFLPASYYLFIAFISWSKALSVSTFSFKFCFSFVLFGQNHLVVGYNFLRIELQRCIVQLLPQLAAKSTNQS